MPHFNLISTKGPAVSFSIPHQGVVFEILIKGTNFITVFLVFLTCVGKSFKHMKAAFPFLNVELDYFIEKTILLLLIWRYDIDSPIAIPAFSFVHEFLPDFKTEEATVLVLEQTVLYRSYNHTMISKLDYIYN